jgi:hypothetical protein
MHARNSISRFHTLQSRRFGVSAGNLVDLSATIYRKKIAILRKRESFILLHYAANMNSPQPKTFQECQRIDVVKQGQGVDAQLKISIERFDECLGWYLAGGLTIPIHQVPLLQQALEEMKSAACAECVGSECPAKKIIPFPMMTKFSSLPAEETGS